MARRRRAPPRVALRAALAVATVLAAGCRGTLPAVRQSAPSARFYDPAHDLGPLFAAVQLAGLFPDSKTFVDARPRTAPSAIAARYAAARDSTGFGLRAFVDRYFRLPQPTAGGYRTDTTRTMEAHIEALWPVLTRPADTPDPHSSLIPLPNPYVVPGGRFREVYYWDSYFTMLGLVASGRTDLVRDMLDNFAYLIRSFGHIPNGNRTYYLSRSQPPYFAAMVGLYARATDTAQALRYLPALEAEHAFWMDGAERLAPGTAYRRVVRLPNGARLNRYWDDLAEPRPESYRQDFELAQTVPPARREALYRNIRATAESGWDFSSRWLRDPGDLRTLETTRLVPVDLNSLLYDAERTIAALRRFRGRPGDGVVAERFERAAEARRRALLAAAYDPDSGFFYDVRWRTGQRVTDRPTLAAAAPLYFGLATPEQGLAVAARLGRDFLRPGGFVTTEFASGQQWDAPNGWPPLEWLAIRGVRRYGLGRLADTAAARWLALNRRTYRATGKMVEKYDVVDVTRRAGGGEYPTQDGFGWTNGVALALAANQRHGGARPPSRDHEDPESLDSRVVHETWTSLKPVREGGHDARHDDAGLGGRVVRGAAGLSGGRGLSGAGQHAGRTIAVLHGGAVRLGHVLRAPRPGGPRGHAGRRADVQHGARPGLSGAGPTGLVARDGGGTLPGAALRRAGHVDLRGGARVRRPAPVRPSAARRLGVVAARGGEPAGGRGHGGVSAVDAPGPAQKPKRNPAGR